MYTYECVGYNSYSYTYTYMYLKSNNSYTFTYTYTYLKSKRERWLETYTAHCTCYNKTTPYIINNNIVYILYLSYYVRLCCTLWRERES